MRWLHILDKYLQFLSLCQRESPTSHWQGVILSPTEFSPIRASCKSTNTWPKLMRNHYHAPYNVNDRLGNHFAKIVKAERNTKRIHSFLFPKRILSSRQQRKNGETITSKLKKCVIRKFPYPYDQCGWLWPSKPQAWKNVTRGFILCVAQFFTQYPLQGQNGIYAH